jgi:hypothetical protein
MAKPACIKVIRLTVTLSGYRFSGTLSQTSNAAPTSLTGSISGSRTNDAATFQVNFSGLMPTVTVSLKLNRQSSYSVRASTFAGTLMDVRLTRAGSR